MSVRADYNPYSQDWTRPAGAAFAITASANDLSHITRGLYVGTAGDVTVTLEIGDSVTFKNLAAGVIHPIACVKVTAATATDILGVY